VYIAIYPACCFLLKKHWVRVGGQILPGCPSGSESKHASD
jgi:hypothetical protein